MRLLLDTHALIWFGVEDDRLSRPVRDLIADSANRVYVSAVSAIEVAIKFRRGKLPSAAPLAADFRAEIEAVGFLPLSITVDHARLAGVLDIPHNDPFDRLLIAQARIENLLLVSNEQIFDGFGVVRLW